MRDFDNLAEMQMNFRIYSLFHRRPSGSAMALVFQAENFQVSHAHTYVHDGK